MLVLGHRDQAAARVQRIHGIALRRGDVGRLEQHLAARPHRAAERPLARVDRQDHELGVLGAKEPPGGEKELADAGVELGGVLPPGHRVVQRLHVVVPAPLQSVGAERERAGGRREQEQEHDGGRPGLGQRRRGQGQAGGGQGAEEGDGRRSSSRSRARAAPRRARRRRRRAAMPVAAASDAAVSPASQPVGWKGSRPSTIERKT